jgi:exodeoxyribonuclease V alpha subunit
VIELVDPRRAAAATGVLATFNEAGVLVAADVHVATRLGALAGEDDEQVLLAAALAVRAVRLGSICLDPTTIADVPLEDPVELPWPEPGPWVDRVAASPLVRDQLLRLDLGRVYLDRYWREEVQVRDDLLARLERRAPEVDEPLLEAGLAELFADPRYAEQRAAARTAVRRATTVLTGGPGTGKTTTVAAILALVAEQHDPRGAERPRIALAAPTGKAAARLQAAVLEAATLFPARYRGAVEGIRAVTVHSLLGSRMPRTSVRFRHDRSHRLPFDVVVIDEASMLSLSMAARVLEALRPDARLLLVGDADQLSSVDAGAVLADVVTGLEARADGAVARLVTNHRSGAGIVELAEALRAPDVGGRADRVLAVLRARPAGVTWIDPEDEQAMADFRVDVHRRAAALLAAARQGSAEAAMAALDDHRLLCAHREGPYGVTGWNREVERMLADLVDGFGRRDVSPVSALTTAHRFGGGIAELAAALRGDDADRVVEVLRSGGDVELVDPSDEQAMAAFRATVTEAALAVRLAAEAGDARAAVDALDQHRLLCAHREGPYGVTGWNREVERMLADGGEAYVYQEWYAGRPVLVSANDRLLRLNNGDLGLTRFDDVAGGRLRVLIAGADPATGLPGTRSIPTSRMPAVQTVWAMTIHKSQGSQARTVSVVLPPADSPLLTRELFYTAVTRAQDDVRIVGTEESIRTAVERDVQRATGLADRLSPST